MNEVDPFNFPLRTCIFPTLAGRQAVLFAHEVGITESSFEGDSEIVINSLQARDKLSSSFGHLLRDILFMLARFSFSHTVRKGNTVAFTLAKRAKSSFPLLVLMEFVPLDSFFVVAIDFPAI